MKPSVAQIENLLASKRHEAPPEGYWQDFLRDFHQLQREQAPGKRGISGWFARVSEWISEMGPSKWAYGAGLAYACATLAFILIPRDAEVETMAPAPVKYEALSAPAFEQLEELDLSPSTQGASDEQIF